MNVKKIKCVYIYIYTHIYGLYITLTGYIIKTDKHEHF